MNDSDRDGKVEAVGWMWKTEIVGYDGAVRVVLFGNLHEVRGADVVNAYFQVDSSTMNVPVRAYDEYPWVDS